MTPNVILLLQDHKESCGITQPTPQFRLISRFSSYEIRPINAPIISFQLCLSGWIGVLLTTCCRYHYPGTKQDGCVFPVKAYHIVSSTSAVRNKSVLGKGLSNNKTIELMQSQVRWMRGCEHNTANNNLPPAAECFHG